MHGWKESFVEHPNQEAETESGVGCVIQKEVTEEIQELRKDEMGGKSARESPRYSGAWKTGQIGQRAETEILISNNSCGCWREGSAVKCTSCSFRGP